MDSFISPVILDITPVTYLCKVGNHLKTLEIRPDGYRFLKQYQRCTKKQSKIIGPKLAAELNLEWRSSHTDINELVAFRRIRKKHRKQVKIETKKRAISGFYSVAEASLSKWMTFNEDKNVDVALAELVRVCNKISKIFPKYKERSDYQNSMVETIYELKDHWIENFNEYGATLTSAVMSAEFTNSYIDWDLLHHMRDITGEWQDSDDYLTNETTTFYAYEFNVADNIFRFHSQTCLVPNCPKDTSKHSATDPISCQELASFGLTELEAVLALALFLDLNAGEVGYEISQESKEKPKNHSREYCENLFLY